MAETYRYEDREQGREMRVKVILQISGQLHHQTEEEEEKN